MQIKLLYEIVVEIAGQTAEDVLKLLMGKKDVNEFLIAKKLKLTINQIRNIFYKLANFGLVSFTRKKDKRKGWYTYFWTLDTERALELLDKRLKKEIDSLEHQLKSRQTKRFYLCKTCRTEVSEETALLHDFTCHECGEVYQLNEDKKIFSELENKIKRLDKQRKSVLEELGIVKEKKAKKIARKDKREEKKKKAEKKAKLKAKKEERIEKQAPRRKIKKKAEKKRKTVTSTKASKRTKTKNQGIKKKQKIKPKKKKGDL